MSKQTTTSAQQAIRILLVDDQLLVREGIKSLLGLSDKVCVVGEAANGSTIVNDIASYQPDLILLDLSMPKVDGLQTLKIMAEKKIATPVIILTTFDDNQLILQAVELGAKGYLLKDIALEDLIDAIKQVVTGGELVKPCVSKQVASDIKQFNNQFEQALKIEQLTAKEIEVLSFMARGFSNKEIAQVIFKSEGTIKNHVSNLLNKLGVRDRTRAVLLAIEKGIIKN